MRVVVVAGGAGAFEGVGEGGGAGEEALHPDTGGGVGGGVEGDGLPADDQGGGAGGVVGRERAEARPRELERVLAGKLGDIMVQGREAQGVRGFVT